MDKKFTNGAKRIFAAMLAVTLLTGTMPGMPAGNTFGNGITVNAAALVPYAHYYFGDTITFDRDRIIENYNDSWERINKGEYTVTLGSYCEDSICTWIVGLEPVEGNENQSVCIELEVDDEEMRTPIGIEFNSPNAYYYGDIDNPYTFALVFADELSGEGTQQNPYLIENADDWNDFCNCLQDSSYDGFSGKFVKLSKNIGTKTDPVTQMAGTNGHDFKGNFDGNNKTLTFSCTAGSNYTAPFASLYGTENAHASISNLNVKTTITAENYRHIAGLVAVHSGYVDITNCNADVNLSSLIGDDNPISLYPTGLVSQSNGTLNINGCTVTGEISTNGKYAAGYVGVVQGTATIENSVSSVTINSSTSGDGTHGGFIAAQQNKKTITIKGCVFNGKLLTDNGTIKCGGFIGWRNSTATIYDSIFAPAELSDGEVCVGTEGSATFARNKVDTYNCYYTYLLNDGTNYAPYLDDGTVTPKKYNNGQQAYTITAGDNVTLSLSGTPTVYNVSGITSYANNSGLKYGNTFYAGKDDSVSLTPSHDTLAQAIHLQAIPPMQVHLTALPLLCLKVML